MFNPKLSCMQNKFLGCKLTDSEPKQEAPVTHTQAADTEVNCQDDGDTDTEHKEPTGTIRYCFHFYILL